MVVEHRGGRNTLKLGFIPLVDCAPLVVAQELGYFSKYGLSVELTAQNSWASLRDKVAFGLLDAAQMLAPMPLAATLGVGMPVTPMCTALNLDLNGNAITLSESLFQRLLEVDPGSAYNPLRRPAALRRVIERDRDAKRAPLNFAVVYPVSSHHYLLRHWLSLGDIDPDRDVRTVVIPPPRMVEHLSAGRIDGFCVGEPWNSLAVELDLGRIAITSFELWPNHPEKVLGVHRGWAERHQETHLALVAALLEAGRWLDNPENRPQAAQMLTGGYLDVPVTLLEPLLGRYRTQRSVSPVELPDYHVFHRYAASFPWRSHGLVWLAELYASGQLERPVNLRDTVEAVYLTGLYREAARIVGIPYPTVDYKRERAHGDPWVLEDATRPIAMGPDRNLPGPVLEPDSPMAFLTAQGVGRVPVDQFAALNPETSRS